MRANLDHNNFVLKQSEPMTFTNSMLWTILVGSASCTALVSTKSPLRFRRQNQKKQSFLVSFESNMSKANQEWDVNRYQNQHGFVWEYGSSMIDLLDPQPGELILDVGCGTGELTKAMSDRGADCIGMDADNCMVQRAQEQFSDVTFFQGDASNFQLDNNQFVDAIFSNAALHWVSDAEAAVKAMARALKPGGRFVVEFGGKGNVRQIVEATLQVLNKPMSANPWYFPSIGEYSTLLERHGIEVTSAALFDRPTVLEGGEEAMKNWLRMFGGPSSLLNDLSEVELNELVAKVDEILRPRLFDGTQWTADYRRIRVVGKKSTKEVQPR